MTLAKRSVPSVAQRRAQVRQHLSRSLPYYVTPEEAHKLEDAGQNPRDCLLMRVFWQTGVRVSEAIPLRLEDVGRQGIRVLGKGSVERVVFVQDALVSAILLYAQENGLDRDDFLFPSRGGGHITKQRADQIIKAGGSPGVPPA